MSKKHDVTVFHVSEERNRPNAMSGWFACKRGITSHPLFVGRPDRLAVWLWLLDNAAWKETIHDVNGHTVKVPRGSVSASERRIADETGVGRQAVRTFLARLKADKMLTLSLTHGRSMITICNWDKYQLPENTANPSKNPRPTHDQPIKETREQDNTLEAKASNAAGAAEPIEVSILTRSLWTEGKRYLISLGVSEKQAGSFIGLCRKTSTDVQILSAIEAAQKSGTQDPIPYITEILKGEPNGKLSERQKFDIAHREYTRRIASGEIERGPDPSDPFAG